MGRTPHRSPRGLRPLRACALALAAWAAAAGCSGAAAGDAPRAPLAFDAARAWKHLEHVVAQGPRPAGSDALQRTRDYIVAELRAAGLEPRVEAFRGETPLGPVSFANVFADVGAADLPLVVLCTHIDTKRFDWPFVGANDSGSGTAVLLELARCLAPLAPRGSDLSGGRERVAYRLLFVDGEESMRAEWVDPDNRYGSRHHVAGLVESGEIRRVRACVLIDLVGDRDLVLSRETLSNQELLRMFHGAGREIGLGAHVDGERLEIRDDHLSFMAADVPSVDLIDFEYGPRNAYWHDRRDTLENVSQESLGVAGRIVLAGLPALERWVLARPR